MTPQQLIDLPGYGQANNRVKAMGMWRETMTDTERIEWLESEDAHIHWTGHDDIWDIRPMSSASPIGSLRPAIDKAATKKTASDYEGYKCA